jgi:hypothetical protein
MSLGFRSWIAQHISKLYHPPDLAPRVSNPQGIEMKLRTTIEDGYTHECRFLNTPVPLIWVHHSNWGGPSTTAGSRQSCRLPTAQRYRWTLHRGATTSLLADAAKCGGGRRPMGATGQHDSSSSMVQANGMGKAVPGIGVRGPSTGVGRGWPRTTGASEELAAGERTGIFFLFLSFLINIREMNLGHNFFFKI